MGGGRESIMATWGKRERKTSRHIQHRCKTARFASQLNVPIYRKAICNALDEEMTYNSLKRVGLFLFILCGNNAQQRWRIYEMIEDLN